MAEKVYGLTKQGILRTAEANRRTLGTLPPTGQTKRKVVWPDDNLQRFEITEVGMGDANLAFYRGSNPDGFSADRLLESGAVAEVDATIYADIVRGVYFTGDFVWCRRFNGKWQIHDDGELTWIAEATEDSTGGPLAVVLDGTNGPVTVTATPWRGQAISMGTSVVVQFLNSPPGFYVMDRDCPAYTVPEA